MSVWISPSQAAEAMERGDGQGVRIAVLDSGVEIAHPDFFGQQLYHDLLPDTNGGMREGNGEDMYGHGTAVSGIIWRLAPKAEIGSFRVLGSSLSARTAQVSVAARKSIALGYNILNCSFGCGISGHLPIYKEWADSALLAGIHVVAASGSPETSEWPAYLSSVLGVDCALSNDAGLRYLPGRMVEFAAPAAEVRVPWKDRRSPCNDRKQLCRRLALGDARQAALRVSGHRPDSGQVVAAQSGSRGKMSLAEEIKATWLAPLLDLLGEPRRARRAGREALRTARFSSPRRAGRKATP